MTTQALPKYTTTCSFEFFWVAEEPSDQPAQYTAYDFGYDVDEDEVGALMAAEYSNDSFDKTNPQVEPDEFETIYHWFLS